MAHDTIIKVYNGQLCYHDVLLTVKLLLLTAKAHERHFVRAFIVI